MTGGGILALVSYGDQNVILSGRPQMTYFYKVFKRYTHFAMENITIPLEGQNELAWDKEIQLRAKIPRFGDLMADMTFSFNLPAIYSKYFTPIPQGREAQWEFQWAPYIGLAAINNAAFFIGGQKIHEVDGSYLLAKALTDMDQDTFAKWSRLVGQVPELVNPAAGEFAGGPSQNTYPTVTSDPTVATGATQANRPSIPARTIHVPLSFWFSQHTGLALPLVALQGQDCEVQLTLNPLQNLYTVLDNSGYRVAPGASLNATLADIQRNNPEYIVSSDPARFIRNFLVDYGVTPSELNTVFINPRLQSTFIYLPEEEQKLFAQRPLSYLITQNIRYPFPGQYQRQVLDLYTSNPVTRLFFVQRRSDAVFRNDFANFTNWFRNPLAPYRAAAGTPSGQAAISSGVVIPNAQKGIIRAMRVICNGNEIQEEKPVDFFTALTPYNYFKGIGDTELPVYTFQIEQNPLQPAGSINASRIRTFQVDLDVYPLPSAPNYTYDVTIYTENINWLLIASGTGGLKFAK
jgi:hypothetical protein